MEENKDQSRSVGGLEHNEKSTHDERGVWTKRQKPYVTHTGEVYTHVNSI